MLFSGGVLVGFEMEPFWSSALGIEIQVEVFTLHHIGMSFLFR